MPLAMMLLALTQDFTLIDEPEVFVFLLKVSIYMPSLKVVKNVIERMKNLSSYLVSGLMYNQFTLGIFISHHHDRHDHHHHHH